MSNDSIRVRAIENVKKSKREEKTAWQLQIFLFIIIFIMPFEWMWRFVFRRREKNAILFIFVRVFLFLTIPVSGLSRHRLSSYFMLNKWMYLLHSIPCGWWWWWWKNGNSHGLSIGILRCCSLFLHRNSPIHLALFQSYSVWFFFFLFPFIPMTFSFSVIFVLLSFVLISMA